jgi:UDP-N-acetylglucosamine transferase subunit ALG13
VFDGFQVIERTGEAAASTAIRRAVVTLGTQPDYGFRRLIVRLVELLPRNAEVLWQVGNTDVGGLGIDALQWVDQATLNRALAEADLVVAHAGIGSAISALEAGRLPVLVPRRRAYREHVDDHQQLLAAALSSRALAVVREVDDLTTVDLGMAARMSVVPADTNPLELAGRLGASLGQSRCQVSGQ